MTNGILKEQLKRSPADAFVYFADRELGPVPVRSPVSLLSVEQMEPLAPGKAPKTSAVVLRKQASGQEPLTVKQLLEQSEKSPDDSSIYFTSAETDLSASGLNQILGGWMLPNKLVLSA